MRVCNFRSLRTAENRKLPCPSCGYQKHFTFWHERWTWNHWAWYKL